METQTLKQLLTISELSVYLNIKKTTLYSWVEQHKIPHLKIHGLIRFNQGEIDAWLRSLNNNSLESATFPRIEGERNINVDEIVARALSSGYNESHGETGPDSCPGKGGDHGAL